MRCLLLVLCAGLAACSEADPCEEQAGAQVLDEDAEVSIGGETILAELADDEVERERGWRKRRCGREGLLLVPDEPAPLPVWGCDLAASVDAFGLRAGQVVYAASIAPCPLPCGDCPTHGDAIVIDAVLEVPPRALDVEVGASVSWE